MKSIILAAGTASRLRPLTNNTPKCLLEVAGKKMLQRTIDNLLQKGLKDIVIVTGYLSNMIEDFISTTYPTLKVDFIYNDVYDNTNNIYSLWLALKHIGYEDIILLDSDIVFDSEIIVKLKNSPHKNVLAINNHPLGDEEIKVIADKNNKLLEISKTASIQKSIGESIGIEIFSKELIFELLLELDEMMKDKILQNVFYEVAFERLISRGISMYAIDTTDYFSMEIDTLQDLEEANIKIPSNLR